MMGYGNGLESFGFISAIVWLLVGILLVVWLWRQLNNK